MPGKTKCHRRSECGWFGLFLVLQILMGCAAEAPDVAEPSNDLTDVTVSGFTIPVFATATEQLNYAKSLSVNLLEKSAALKLIVGRFPNDRQQQGGARLELAYIHLGDDFRLADAAACEKALAAYEAIAREFADLPAVRAKAYWYMAWIYTDLLEKKEKGLALYSLLAEKYPEDRFSRIFPVPWLKLVFPNPEIKHYTADDEHTHSWAGLALLEIVRNADNPETRMNAFEKLWLEHRHSLTTGYALKEILRQPPTSETMARIVDEYVKGNTINSELNKDLLSGLAQWASPIATN
ncbi:MAG: hypothetical protein HGJ94_12000 [Desulfosarcina sp.]|nr:hypothetical protein [Desulfosarcina sp.]MBC2742738.1 hypothetical protein [Desulfosarcina sp.]MBC2765648.1 hypothetical protein [Desulfosarcina sp.]